MTDVESPTTRGIRVTQVAFDLDGGGLESLVLEMARHWSGSSVRVSAITLGRREGRVGAQMRRYVEKFLIPGQVPVASLAAPVALMHAIRETRPDIVHLHSGAWFKCAWACRLLGIRGVVYTEHGREHHDSFAQVWLDRIASSWTAAVVAVSDRVQDYMLRRVQVRSPIVRTIINGVDTTRFHPCAGDDSVRTRLRIPPTALVVGSIGRLEQVKRYDRLLAAFAALPRQIDGRPLHLCIHGEGSQRSALEAQVATLGLGDRVVLPGWTHEAADAYRALDVFVLSSDSEGMSVSLLEAMASGAAPVVTNVGSNAELLGPRLSRQIVEREDVAALSDTLLRTLGSPPMRAQVIAEARARVVSTYSLGAMLEEYAMLYREILLRQR